MSNRTISTAVLGPLVVAALSLCSAARSATLRVPQDYSTIAGAANIAQRSDSILVNCGSVGYCDYEDEQITLRQGVVLRGMEEIYPDPHMQIRNSVISLLEESPSPNDTTRIEHLSIYNPPFHETIQVYTPRSSITDCYFWTSGPYDYTTVRVWKGGVIARNYFAGTGECNGMEARQGTVKVVGNAFVSLFRSFALYNTSAPEPASLYFRNNNVGGPGDMYVYPRADSYAELVNNIVVSGHRVNCSGPVSAHYNDIYQAFTSCPLGIGNISADPLACVIPQSAIPWVQPNSPCVGTGEGGATMGAGGICGVSSVGGQELAPPRVHLTVDPNPVFSTGEFAFGGAIGNPTLEIFDPQGRLIDLIRPIGQRVRWSSGSWPRGVYFARLRGAGVSQTVKFLVIR